MSQFPLWKRRKDKCDSLNHFLPSSLLPDSSCERSQGQKPWGNVNEILNHILCPYCREGYWDSHREIPLPCTKGFKRSHCYGNISQSSDSCAIRPYLICFQPHEGEHIKGIKCVRACGLIVLSVSLHGLLSDRVTSSDIFLAMEQSYIVLKKKKRMLSTQTTVDYLYFSHFVPVVFSHYLEKNRRRMEDE